MNTKRISLKGECCNITWLGTAAASNLEQTKGLEESLRRLPIIEAEHIERYRVAGRKKELSLDRFGASIRNLEKTFYKSGHDAGINAVLRHPGLHPFLSEETRERINSKDQRGNW